MKERIDGFSIFCVNDLVVLGRRLLLSPSILGVQPENKIVQLKMMGELRPLLKYHHMTSFPGMLFLSIRKKYLSLVWLADFLGKSQVIIFPSFCFCLSYLEITL